MNCSIPEEEEYCKMLFLEKVYPFLLNNLIEVLFAYHELDIFTSIELVSFDNT